MTKKLILAAALLAAIAPTQSWSQEAWPVNATCSVTAPAADGKPRLTIVSTMKIDAKAAPTSTIQLRVQTDDVVLKDDEKAADVSVSFPQQKDFTGLAATGNVRGKTNLVVIAVPLETRMLAFFSRGSSAIIKIPTAAGEKQLEIDLKGSGAAIKQLVARCG